MADLIRYPTGVHYQEALYNTGLAFQDSALRGGEPDLDPLGMPKAISGAFASVFTINGTDGRRWAVKCFTRHVPDQAFRYQQISQALQEINSPWKVDFKYLSDGVLCRGVRYPVLKMEWIEGTGLLPYTEAHLTDSSAIADLAEKFGDLVRDLSRHGIAHGDLQHGNILVMPSGELKLIDYDGMFVPGLASLGASELGHANYQSPLRTSNHWGPDLDRFSSWVIYASLSALAVDPLLWRVLHTDGDETLLFHQSDFTDRDGSRARYALMSSTLRRLREIAKEIDFLWARDLTAIPPLEAALDARTAAAAGAAGAAGKRKAGNATAASPAQTGTGTDWLRQFGVNQGGATATAATHSSARQTGPIGTAAWVTTHLPQSPRADFARPMTVRRVFFAVVGLLTLASVLATAAVPFLVLIDIILAAMWWTLSLAAYQDTPERREKRQCRRAFKRWRKAAAKRSRTVAGLEGYARKLDRKTERSRVRVLKKVDQAHADEQRDMTAVENKLAQEIDRLDRAISAHQGRANAEIASALRVLQQNWVSQRLAAARVSSASIPGVGPTLKLSLALAGIATAADFTDVRFVTNQNGSRSAYFVRRDGTHASPRGIGEKKARELNNWRLEVESNARATWPTVLPQAQESEIAAKYAKQTQSLEKDKQAAVALAAQRRESVRKEWAATHQDIERELNEVTARFARQRAEKDTEIAAARQHAQAAIWRRDFAQRERERYRSITYRHYVRRLITG